MLLKVQIKRFYILFCSKEISGYPNLFLNKCYVILAFDIFLVPPLVEGLTTGTCV